MKEVPIMVKGFVDFEACEHVCEVCAAGCLDTDGEGFAPLDWEEVDSPANCSGCGRLIETGGYTADGVAYVLDTIRRELRKPRAARVAPNRNGPPYYVGSPACSVVLDWAHDVRSSVDGRDRRMVDLFIQWSS